MAEKMGPQIAAQRMIPFLAPMSIHPCLEQEQFDLLVGTMKTMILSIEEWRKEEFKAKAEVAIHMSQENPQAEFIKQQNFQNLVSSEFQEKQSSIPNSASTQRIVANAPPPTDATLSSFEELIRSEETARQKHLNGRNQKEIFTQIGGEAVQQNSSSTATAFKNLQISEPSTMSNESAFEFGAFDIQKAPAAPKRTAPPPAVQPTKPTTPKPQSVSNDLFGFGSGLNSGIPVISPSSTQSMQINSLPQIPYNSNSHQMSSNSFKSSPIPPIDLFAQPGTSQPTPASNYTGFSQTQVSPSISPAGSFSNSNASSSNSGFSAFSQIPQQQPISTHQSTSSFNAVPQQSLSEFSFGNLEPSNSYNTGIQQPQPVQQSNTTSNFDFDSFSSNENADSSGWDTTSFSTSNFFS